MLRSFVIGLQIFYWTHTERNPELPLYRTKTDASHCGQVIVSSVENRGLVLSASFPYAVLPYKFIATSSVVIGDKKIPDKHVIFLIQSFAEVRTTLPAASLPLKRNMSMPTYSANAARNML